MKKHSFHKQISKIPSTITPMLYNHALISGSNLLKESKLHHFLFLTHYFSMIRKTHLFGFTQTPKVNLKNQPISTLKIL